MPSPGPSRATDLLRWPLLGPLLRWRHVRAAAQIVLLAVAIVIVLHGLLGRQLAATNLATVLTWIHYRGLLIGALLLAGNLFCGACPMILVRDAARRFHRPSRRWPKRLGKWGALALFAAALFAYELFDLWSLPAATAWIVLGYFGAALAVDLTFTGASFCKYVCPVGQFNFVASTLSPLEVRVRDRDVCRTCKTVDCIKGRRDERAPRVVTARGCELALFLPAKVGNLDCTFCLDCVQACPHDNIALTGRTPGIELADERRRSGIGRLARRPDLAVLSVLFAFAAMLNAFAMVSPVHRVEQWLSAMLGTTSEFVVLSCMFAFGLGAAPVVLVGLAAGSTRATSGGAGSLIDVATRYAYAFVPFGFGMWLAHYSFHFLTGALTVVPVTQNATVDLLGWPALGEPLWRWAGMRPGAVFPIQLGCIVLGTIGSLAIAHLISQRDSPERAVRATAPWVVAFVLLAAVAIWVLFQPMEMRGLGFGA